MKYLIAIGLILAWLNPAMGFFDINFEKFVSSGQLMLRVETIGQRRPFERVITIKRIDDQVVQYIEGNNASEVKSCTANWEIVATYQRQTKITRTKYACKVENQDIDYVIVGPPWKHQAGVDESLHLRGQLTCTANQCNSETYFRDPSNPLVKTVTFDGATLSGNGTGRLGQKTITGCLIETEDQICVQVTE